MIFMEIREVIELQENISLGTQKDLKIQLNLDLI